MPKSYKVSYFMPLEPGVFKMGFNGSKRGNGYSFALDTDNASFKECGIILYDKASNETKIPFSDEGKCGSLYGLCVEDIDESFTYNFYIDNECVEDAYARAFTGFKGFGKRTHNGEIKALINNSDFDWQNDKMLKIPYENSIFYGLNVRAFTMHRSSKVVNKGTFEGIVEKIPYLKELGITALVLMPSYEFDECEAMRAKKRPKNVDEAKGSIDEGAVKGRINCWGFLKGYYFAPKSTYAAGDNPVISFKTMVRELHKAGIEVIMQFYFTPDVKQTTILSALKYWVNEYHVDGFRISGFFIPYRMLINEPMLKETKLWFSYIPHEELECVPENPRYRALSADNGSFRSDMRRFIKGDEGMIGNFIGYQRCNPGKHAVVNYICDYDGFTLLDLYSYERKHNEENGEENRDGTDINYSWNCGAEGPSRKKTINMLRLREIKNALSLVFLSAGTPYIFSGDEFLNSRAGNNNAYCQDNEIGYIKWKDTALSREVFDFTKKLISLRRDNPILRMKDELKVMDSKGLGYPDLSYHGFEAWRPDLGFISRMVGLFLYGEYSGDKKASSFYIGVNMHWESHRLAVPKLKNGYEYKKIMDTGESTGTSPDNEIPIGERSVVIYEAVPKGRKKQ